MKACMVSYSFYEMDNRVRRYAETLVRHGYEVEAIALRQRGAPKHCVVNGVNVYGIQERVRNERNKLTYLYRLLTFFFSSLWALTRRHLREPYDLIHVHSVPDFEVFAALVPKLKGCPIILDIHDIVPEFYASKFHVSQKSLTFKILVKMEQLSAAFADHVIASNHIWHKRLAQRSVKESKISTFLNFPDDNLFQRTGRARNDGRFVALYPGSLNYHQGLDLAIRAFSIIGDECPEAEFHIYGSGENENSLKELISTLSLESRVLIKPPVPLDQMASIMEDADLGLVPKRSTSFGDEAFSTKILEFMTMGVPLLIADTTIDKYYFNDSIVRFFASGNEKRLAEALVDLIRNPAERRSMSQRASAFVAKYSWGAHENDYLELISRLQGSEKGAGKRPPLVQSGTH